MLCVLVLCSLAASPADARTTANPAHRAVFGAEGPPPALASGFAATATEVMPVPLPAGAEAIDSTWYDLQDMGSLGTHIVCGADGRVHLTYQKDYCELGGGCPPNLGAPQPHPYRAMGYALRDAVGTWAHLGKVQDPLLRNCCLSELLGGFGALAVTTTGRAVVAQHMNEDGCDLRGDFYLEDAAGGASWTGYLSPIQSPSNLFPQVVANPNGSFTLMGEVPKGGEYDETNEFRVSYFAGSGTRFVCPTGWQGGAWTAVAPASLFRDGKPAFPSIAGASDGRVGIAVGDFGGNVYLIESSNGTFAPGTIVIRNLTSYTDAAVTATDSTSTQFRPYVHCHLAYRDTTPNVVWSELQARRSGANVVYFDYHSRIRHWDPVRGAETVYQVAPGVADRYDDIDNGLSGPLAGFNTLSVDWPQVGFSADGLETYVAWLRFTDAEVDPTANAGLPGICTGIGFGDIAASVTRPGSPWAAAQNLTNTNRTDERFFSLAARNAGGRAHVVFQASATDQAGSAIIGDRGTSPGNLLRRIAYLERPLTSSIVGAPPGTMPAVAALQASPNPSRGEVRLAFPGRAQARAAFVYAVNGAFVARVPIREGADFVVWDARRQNGQPAPNGLYFMRLEGVEAPAARVVLAR